MPLRSVALHRGLWTGRSTQVASLSSPETRRDRPVKRQQASNWSLHGPLRPGFAHRQDGWHSLRIRSDPRRMFCTLSCRWCRWWQGHWANLSLSHWQFLDFSRDWVLLRRPKPCLCSKFWLMPQHSPCSSLTDRRLGSCGTRFACREGCLETIRQWSKSSSYDWSPSPRACKSDLGPLCKSFLILHPKRLRLWKSKSPYTGSLGAFCPCFRPFSGCWHILGRGSSS